MPDDDLVDRHRGDDATVTISLRTALDLWMIADRDDFHDPTGLTLALDAAAKAAGFGDIVHAYHLCGPGVLSNEAGTACRRGAEAPIATRPSIEIIDPRDEVLHPEWMERDPHTGEVPG